jgi:serine/threonine-protein kinase
VTYDGEVKVLDFGIAKANRQAEHTEIGVIKGKFRYMAPEQVNGSPMDARTDVFAAGIILWEALTGQRLWAGFSDAKLLQVVMEGDIPPPRAIAPDVPEVLEKVCLRATASNAVDRYQSAQEMALELASAARELRLPSGRELLASYLDAHYREMRRAVRAQVESELADATFREEDRQAGALWEASTSHVSIAPELSDPHLPNDSLGGSSVPVQAAMDSEEEPVAGEIKESDSGGLLIGSVLGFLACAVALLAWNRFAPEPTQALAVPSFSKPVASPEREQSARTAHGSVSALPSGDSSASPPPALGASVGAPDAVLLPPIQPPSSGPSQPPARAAKSARKPAGSEQSPTTSNPVEAPTTEAAPPPSPACAIPFELTPDGLKHFKPECLPR